MGPKNMDFSAENEELAKYGVTIIEDISSGRYTSIKKVEKKTAKKVHQLAAKVVTKMGVPPTYIDRFINKEIILWNTFKHRHLLKFQGSFELDHRIYLLMEFAPNESVAQYLKKNGPIDLRLGRDWTKQTCLGVRYLHLKNIAHRDIRCDNLLLTANLEVKLCGFEFCTNNRDSEKDRIILSYTFCGSLSYMAPEIKMGDSYDAMKADIYSTGVSIFLILNNKLPFPNPDPAQVFLDQMNSSFDFKPEVKQDLSRSAKSVIQSMLSPEPGLRPSVDELFKTNWLKRKCHSKEGE